MTDHEVFGSWKEIADYLGKEIRTCWRWEKELGLPVHRIDSTSRRSRVFAYKAEIDSWLKERAASDDASSKSFLSRKGMLFGIGLTVLAALTVLGLSLTGRRSASYNRPSRPVSIAVLPFADTLGAKQEAYYSEGITQEIIKSLRAYDQIAVIPFPPAYENSTLYEKPDLIGRELGLDYVLKGRLNRQKKRIYLAVDFNKATNDQPLWSAQYAEPLRNLAEVKDDIQTRICRTLNIKKSQGSLEPVTRAAGEQSQTLENYVKGNFVLSRLEGQSSDPWLLYYQGKFYSEQFTAADNELAISLFRQAVAADSSYAKAYIGLATCYIDYIAFGWDVDIQWLNKAEELLNKAQALQPDLPEYFGALLVVLLQKEFGFGQDQETQILTTAQEGLRRFPNDQQLNSIFGVYYLRRYGIEGQVELLHRAQDYKRRAFWLNPYAFNNITYAEILLMNAEYDKAIEVCHQAEKLDMSLMVRFLLGEVYYYQGDLDRSWSVFLSFEALPRLHVFSLYYMAMIAARKGEVAAARKLLAEIDLVSPREFKYFPTKRLLASAYLGVNDTDKGFKCLSDFLTELKTSNEKYFEYGFIDIDPNFTKYRKDPRFVEILKEKEYPSWLGAQKSK